MCDAREPAGSRDRFPPARRIGSVGRGRRPQGQRQSTNEGRILARPAQAVGPIERGLHPLALDSQRDGLLYVPSSYDPARPAPLVLMLHGAGGNAEHGIAPLLELAETEGIMLLA